MQELRDAYNELQETTGKDEWIEKATPPETSTDFRSARDVYYDRFTGSGMGTNKQKKKSTTVEWKCDHPQAAAISCYLVRLLQDRSCFGVYEIQSIGSYMDFTTFNFAKTESLCPGCGCQHPGYNFQYKIKPGKYGGWKCWKDDSWFTQFHWEEFKHLFHT